MSRGWRIEVDPQATVSRTAAGFTLPVNVFLDHRHVVRLDLALTAQQIESLYARGPIAAGGPGREISQHQREGLVR